MIGEKTVDLAITTDSELTPRLSFKMHLIGGRTPPFLLKTEGSLQFNPAQTASGISRENQAQDLWVTTVEQNARESLPVVTSSHSNIAISYNGFTTKPYAVPGAHYKLYNFKVLWNGEDRTESASGEITVQDPWDSSHKLTTNFFVIPIERLSIIPRAIIHRIVDLSDNASVTQFIIFDKVGGSIPPITFEYPENSPLIIEPIPSPNNQKHIYTLRLGRTIDSWQSVCHFKVRSPCVSTGFIPVTVSLARP